MGNLNLTTITIDIQISAKHQCDLVGKLEKSFQTHYLVHNIERHNTNLQTSTNNLNTAQKPTFIIVIIESLSLAQTSQHDLDRLKNLFQSTIKF